MARQKLSSREITKRKRAGLYHDGRRALTAKIVERLKGPGRYHDGLISGLGLHLQVGAIQTKSWLKRFERDGRDRWMGLGGYPLVSLAEARNRARAAGLLLLDGIDPIEARKEKKAAAKLAAAVKLTFRQAATRYAAQHEGKWANESHRAQFLSSLEIDAFPIIGNMDVAVIDTPDVLRVLEPIWTIKTETANRVRNRIENVLDWAVVRGHRPKSDNPARWGGHLDQLFPERRALKPIIPHKALPYGELPGFLVQLRAARGVAARALEFTILTAARAGETFGAVWAEFDLQNALWIKPGSRMKAGDEHRVPLSADVLALLRALPRKEGNPYVFVGGHDGRLSKNAMRRVLLHIGVDVTAHGFRSAFSTWAHEQTAHAIHTIELSLAHKVGNEVARAYMRGDMFQKRIALMQQWAKYCSSGKAARSGDNVTALRKVEA